MRKSAISRDPRVRRLVETYGMAAVTRAMTLIAQSPTKVEDPIAELRRILNGKESQ